MQDLTSLVVPTQFACGKDHTIVAGDSRIYGFGKGEYGQFGHVVGLREFQAAELEFSFAHVAGSEASASVTGNVQVCVGNKHTLILKDGNVYATGDSSLGRLGLAKTSGKGEGRLLFGRGFEDKIGFINSGPDHSVAVSVDGVTCYAWGACDRWGVGKHDERIAPSPKHDGALADDFEADDSGAGDEYGPSNGSSGSNGKGGGGEEAHDPPYFKTPRRFLCFEYDPKTPHRIIQISCGSQHTLALREDGFVYSWGKGADGRLGHNGTETLTRPTALKAFMKSDYERVIAVAAGFSHSLALDAEGKVWSWGNCSWGKLGHPELQKTQAHQLKPKQIQGIITRGENKEGVVSISCNQYHSLAITNTHRLFIWGANQHGRLGLGDIDKHRWAPEEVAGLPRIIRAACGLHHTVAVSDSGAVFAWGQATSFKCGVAPDKGSSCFAKPRKIAFFDDKGVYKYFKEAAMTFSSRQYSPLAVATGDAHSLALCEGSQLVAWGSNSSGQLGTGQQTHSDRPIPLMRFLEDHMYLVAIACGANHCLVLSNNGQMWSWGDNSEGQLGLSSKDSARTPMPIKSLATTHVVSIACGARTCAAVERDIDGRGAITNRVFTWGDNRVGQAGLGPKVARQDHPVPMVFDPLARYQRVEVAIGSEHMMILCKNFDSDKPELITRSRLYAVGRGKEGQLGVLTDSSSTVYVPTKVRTWEGWGKVMREGGAVDPQKERRKHALNRQLRKGGGGGGGAGTKKGTKKGGRTDTNGNTKPTTTGGTEDDEEMDGLLGAKSRKALEDELAALEIDGRVITESDAEWEQEGDESSDDDEDNPAAAMMGGGGSRKSKRAQAQANGGKGKKGAGGASSSSVDAYPHIASVSCGEFGTVAAVQRFHDKSMDFVFAWGRHEGLFDDASAKGAGGTAGGSSGSASAPGAGGGGSEQLLPRFVTAFEGDSLRNELGSQKPIFDFRVLQIVCAKAHTLLLAVYNMEVANPVVFAFGDTTFGKLGVGVVHKYLAAKQQQRKLMSSSSSSSGAGSDAGDGGGKKFLPPSLVPALSGSGRVISSIATCNEHSLALSAAHGAVYGWGVVGDGRLGLSDGQNDKSLGRTVDEPRQLPAFVGGLEADGGAAGGVGSSRSPLGGGVGHGAGADGFGGAGGHAGGRMMDPSAIGGGGGLSSPSGYGGGGGGGAHGGDGFSSVGGVASSGGADAASGGGSGFIGRGQKRREVVKYNKQMLAKMEEDAKSQIGPLAKQYEAELALYNERRTKCDTQKDLLLKMISERLAASQAHPQSITKQHNISKQRRDAEDKKIQLAQMRQAAINAAGKRSLWQRLTGRGVDLKQVEAANLEMLAQSVEDDDDEQAKLTRYAHSSELSTLEECIGRLYLRPCLLFQLFQICQRNIEFKEHHAKDQKKASDIELEIQFLKSDMSDLIYAIYDLYYPGDMRLAQVLVRMILEKHVQINRSELILHPDKIEWIIFSRAFSSGPIRRQLGDILASAINHLKSYEQSPAELMHNYSQSKAKDINEVAKAIRAVREKGAELVHIICEHDHHRYVRDLLTVMGPFIEILYESLGKSSHKDPKIFSRAILSVCMEVAIADMPYQFERLLRMRGAQRDKARAHASDSKRNSRKNSQNSRLGSVMTRLSVMDGPTYSGAATPKVGAASRNKSGKGGGGDGGSRNGAPGGGGSGSDPLDDEKEAAEMEEKFETSRYESNKLVLLNLLSPRDLKEYMSIRYKGVDNSVLDQTIDGKVGGGGGGGGGGRGDHASGAGQHDDDQENNLMLMKIFSVEISNAINARRVEDVMLGSYDKARVDFEKDLYNDFVSVRSKCHRRFSQLTKSSLGNLCRNARELFNPTASDMFEHKIREMEEMKYEAADDTRINVRHDVYNTDRFARVQKCADCGLLHPYTQQLDDLVAKKKALEAAAKAAGVDAESGGGGGSSGSGSGGPAKSSAQKLLEEELRFPTEDCLALWSVLNEDDIKYILSSRPGATGWKEVETRLEELTAHFKKASSKDDEQSDRYLQANTFFRQFSRANRNSDKRILLYFGSEAKHYVEARSLEPIDLFHHLTQLSMQLQVENQANKNKAAVVQTVLQNMQAENKNLASSDANLTDAYRQLHSAHPNISAISDLQFKSLQPGERDLFARDNIEPLLGELNVYIDTKGHAYSYSYSELVAMGILCRVHEDPSLTSCWSLNCLSSSICLASKPKEVTRLVTFLTSLRFLFLTGHPEHHIVEFHLLHANTAKLHSCLLDLKRLPHTDFKFTYEPRGDHVEIEEAVEFEWEQLPLREFLRKMSRPRLHNAKGEAGAAGGLGNVTGLDLLGWDAAKFG